MTGLAAAKRSRHPAKQAARPRRAHPEHCSFPPRRFPLRPRYPIRVFPHPQGTARRRKSRRGPRRVGVGGRGRRALPAAACVEGCADGYGIARFPPAWLPAADGPGLFPFAFEAPPSRGWRKGRFRLFIPCGTCEERRFLVEVRAWETLKRLCDRFGKMSRKKKTIFILFYFSSAPRHTRLREREARMLFSADARALFSMNGAAFPAFCRAGGRISARRAHPGYFLPFCFSCSIVIIGGWNAVSACRPKAAATAALFVRAG